MDGRRLAVRSRHRGEPQPSRRVVEELRGEVRDSGACVRHDRDRNARLDRVLSDHGDRAVRDGIGRERMAIAVKPRDRDEECGLLRTTRVVCDLAHVDPVGSLWDRDARGCQERAEFHGRIRPARRSAEV